MNDLDTLRFYRYQVQPLLIYLYLEAKLEAPSTFDHKIEGPRLVATLREQGFSMNFPIEDIVPTKNAREKKS